MDILRANAKAEFGLIDSTVGNERKFAPKDKPCQNLTIITAHSSASADGIKPEYTKTNENGLKEKIAPPSGHSNATRPVGETPGQPSPCLELVFLPPPKKDKRADFPEPKGFSITKDCFGKLFEYLGIDDALLGYLTSSRSGWYCVRGRGNRHSFLYKDYMYTLAWTFDVETEETRGMLAARSHFKNSKLRVDDETLKLPTLSKALLGQPLALAFIALADCVAYLENIIETDGYGLGKIESRTGYGLWVKPVEKTGKAPRKASANMNLDELEEALRKIAKLIGQFLTLFKSVQISQSMTKTIEHAIKHPGRWGLPSKLETDEEPSPWEEAVHLLKARMHSVDQSGKATIRRAKAMSNVVSGLISRLVARRAVADGSSMRVIALMTMFFLPATFVSALWAIPALDNDDALTKKNFAIYWVVTIPVTLVVFMAWLALDNDWKLLKKIIPALDKDSQSGQDEKSNSGQDENSNSGQGLRDRQPTGDLESGMCSGAIPLQTWPSGHSNSNNSRGVEPSTGVGRRAIHRAV